MGSNGVYAGFANTDFLGKIFSLQTYFWSQCSKLLSDKSLVLRLVFHQSISYFIKKNLVSLDDGTSCKKGTFVTIKNFIPAAKLNLIVKRRFNKTVPNFTGVKYSSISTFPMNFVDFGLIIKLKFSFEFCFVRLGVLIELETSTRHESVYGRTQNFTRCNNHFNSNIGKRVNCAACSRYLNTHMWPKFDDFWRKITSFHDIGNFCNLRAS